MMMGATITADDLNLSNLAKHFSDEAAAWQLLEAIRWPESPVCPHCGVIGDAYYLEPKAGARRTRTGNVSYRRLWKCGACREQFSVLVGTIFEDSKIPLSKWMLGMHLMCASKNGVAALELARTLKLAYRSAWFMCHRIRYAMAATEPFAKMTGTVEMDETYMGGVAKGSGSGKGKALKTPVVTLVNRGGEARSQVMHHVTSENIADILHQHTVPDQTTLVTDEFPAYRRPGETMAGHETVNHREGEYGRGWVYTNTVEGFYSQLKRSIDGTHHHVSEYHLPRYLAEFDFRYSNRKAKDGERTVKAIAQAAGKRLMYRDTVVL